MVSTVEPGQVWVEGFVLTLAAGAGLFAVALAWWRGQLRSSRLRYGTVQGATPGAAMCLGAGFASASARYLTAGPVGVVGGVAFFVLVGLAMVYMAGYGILGMPNCLRPRPQRGVPRPHWSTPEEDDGGGDASWADSVIRRRPRGRR